jgi:predicted N-formylglutamate amidohydrolase
LTLAARGPEDEQSGDLEAEASNLQPDFQQLLLAPDEPAPFEFIPSRARHPALLVCDHASARIPASLGTLGLPPARLADHIALDIGAAALTRKLVQRLQIPAVLGGYSRLVVDCNRRLDDPSAFPQRSDGVDVPGNAHLNEARRQQRAETLYWPYHHAVRDQLTSLESSVRAPALLAIHSFTPTMNGLERPWQVGILWDKDPRIPVPMMDALRQMPGLVVGDNEPYSGRHPADFTIDHHAEAEGLPHVSLEVRQDLITTDEGADRWADVLAEVLLPILDDASLYVHWSGR